MSQLQEAANTLKTINDLVRWAVSRFNEAGIYLGHGTNNMWDEAVSLILPALHLQYDLPDLAWQANLTPSEINHILELVARRIEEYIPAAYLTKSARFANLNFYVDQRVLIPRSPIAELIERRFEPWLHQDHAERILDMCTGSGCIAVACAHYLPEARVDAVDISSDALEVAKINVEKHQVDDRVRLYEGDLFAPLPKKHQYDLIVTNPPYVDADDMSTLPREYLHEPQLGLAAGQDGLDIVKRILHEAKNYLKPNGVLIIEVGNSETALMHQFPNVPFTWLDFERGDGGVFLLTYQDLVNYL
ncbi:MAG: Site-specific DNA-methyltransferase (adenine-specific) [Gammaproteobacteria bacterium]|nr:Site-specific DNA-methyltransferase (adenine-specific) [Gammaproteobacteria bacterium]